MSLMPSEEEEEGCVISRTDLVPADKCDDPGCWERFKRFFRQHIGLKPLWLSQEYATARVEQEKAKARLMNAKAAATLQKGRGEYLKLLAEARSIERDSKVRETLAEASAEESGLKADLLRRLLTAKDLSPEEAFEAYESIKSRIELLGGAVEIDLGDDNDDA